MIARQEFLGRYLRARPLSGLSPHPHPLLSTRRNPYRQCAVCTRPLPPPGTAQARHSTAIPRCYCRYIPRGPRAPATPSAPFVHLIPTYPSALPPPPFIPPLFPCSRSHSLSPEPPLSSPPRGMTRGRGNVMELPLMEPPLLQHTVLEPPLLGPRLLEPPLLLKSAPLQRPLLEPPLPKPSHAVLISPSRATLYDIHSRLQPSLLPPPLVKPPVLPPPKLKTAQTAATPTTTTP